MGSLLAAVVAFVGTHELMSHPLRRSLVQRVFGAAMQDRKKRLLLSERRAAWEARTAFVPSPVR